MSTVSEFIAALFTIDPSNNPSVNRPVSRGTSSGVCLLGVPLSNKTGMTY